MLTLKKYEKIKQAEIFDSGLRYMKDEGMKKWVAVKGYGIDWCIYYDDPDKELSDIINWGKKLYDVKLIREFVKCSNRIFDLYRM